MARRLLPAGPAAAPRAGVRRRAADLDRDQRLLLLPAAPTSYAAWRDQMPDDFVFAVKGGRFITHLKRLRDVETPLANFFASGRARARPQARPGPVAAAGELAFDADVLAAFFALLPRTTRGRRARRAPRRQGPRRPGADPHRGRPAAAPRPGVPQPTFAADAAFALLREHDVGLRASPTRPAGGRGRAGHRRLPLRAAARRPGALRQRLHRRGAGRAGPSGAAAGPRTGATCSSTSTTTSRATRRTTRCG